MTSKPPLQIENTAGQGELWKELSVKSQWFHVMRSVITDEIIAKIGVVAWAVYCAIKAHSNMKTGESFPSQERIARLIGKSTDTVARALAVLEEANMIESKKEGRRSVYHVIESMPLTEGTGTKEVRAGEARSVYAGEKLQDIIESIKEFAKTGQMPLGATFNITLNVNQVTQGDHGVVNISQVTMASEGEEPVKLQGERFGQSDVSDAKVKAAKLFKSIGH